MRGFFGRGALAALVLIAGVLAQAGVASAQIAQPFGPDGPACSVESGGERLCTGVVESFDGAPVDVKLLLPPEPQNAAQDGDYPLVMGFHGWGGDKDEYDLERWTAKGYAAFSMSDRGWGMSCGGQDPKRLTPQCTGTPPGQGGSRGYNHLMDTRFEVRDAQTMAGRLVDSGVADPDAIGATGPSYGGGISMALAALNDRTMLGALAGEQNGELVAWESPDGTPLHIAAAAPDIPWTDLAYSLVPNGSTLDYASNNSYDKGRFGVLKQSFVTGLYGVGVASSNFTPLGTDPSADVNAWYVLLTAGEPYEGNPEAEHIADEVTAYHSSYYIDDSVEPAPLLIANGWTDDLFPVDEAVRYYHRTLAAHPSADISLMFLDFGHARGQNKAADTALLRSRQEAWFDWYLKGQGAKPANRVEALTQTCDGPSAGPFTAPDWASLAPGEVRFRSAGAQQITPGSGSLEASRAFDPIAGDGACATASAEDQPGVANLRLPEPQGDGYTLMGSPTIVADIDSGGANNQLVGRLVDVDPEGQETLVARGVLRPKTTSGAVERQVFQLHPNGYEFAPGHVAKLELLPSDVPYVRASNGQTPITVSNLDLRLPVLDEPGSGGVTQPAEKFLPPGYELAEDFRPQPEPIGCPSDLGGIRGTKRADRIRGTTGADRIYGLGGADVIRARGGADCVRPGPGRDLVIAARGRDLIRARAGGIDVIRCGAGRDVVLAGRRDKTRGCEQVIRPPR